MTSMTLSDLVQARLADLYCDPNLSRFAEQEAQRLIHAIGLLHPMTLPAAVKVACDVGYVDSREVEAVALMLFMQLARGRERLAA